MEVHPFRTTQYEVRTFVQLVAIQVEAPQSRIMRFAAMSFVLHAVSPVEARQSLIMRSVVPTYALPEAIHRVALQCRGIRSVRADLAFWGGR
jgi:hypothetical protein